MSASRLVVIGLGLIGGSVALAARRADSGRSIRAVDPDASTLRFALERGIADEALTPDRALAAGWFRPGAADLVVLGTPVEATRTWLALLAEQGFDGIVTDTGSTKAPVIAAVPAGTPYRFVGGHPMAGSERSGITAASGDLFSGAYYILTPTSSTDMDAYRAVHAFAASLGARLVSVDAAVHDEAVATVSHVPHVAAAALVTLAGNRAEEGGSDLLRLAAGGFKDTTRVAAGSPGLWTGICLDNARALASGIAELETVLGTFRRAVEEGDAEAVHQWLEQAAERRRALPAQWVPATSALQELAVPITDQPGAVARVTTAVSRAGCNIEDIDIDHQSEDRAVLHLVLTDEGDVRALIDDLTTQGFAPTLRALEPPAPGQEAGR